VPRYSIAQAKGIFQLHVDRDACKENTDTPEGATL